MSMAEESNGVTSAVLDNGNSELTDSAVKRKRPDGEQEESTEDAELKKSKAESIIAELASPAAPTNAETGSTEMMEIPPEKVGQVIGSRGAIIQEMQTRSGCKIFVNQDFPQGVPRQVSFSGTAAQIKAARELVNMIVNEGPTSIHMLDGPILEQEVECPQGLVGRIIGSSGATIRELQSKCGAKIQINQNFPDGVNRKIMVTGSKDAVQYAVQLLNFVMENGPSLSNLPPRGGAAGGMGGGGAFFNAPAAGGPGVSPMTSLPNGQSQQTIECAKQYVGRIIGRSGETINLIQSKSGSKIQIDQSVPEGQPCKVSITGTPPSVTCAVQHIQELITNGPD
eukprot:CAMPEP_0182427706 /NCGR_PEP_ID=MMETSP1167-20130531/19001_1 /TAXON_ID=2988 /ORGANISM="Mallomonas Sp, Strain CCMP3275" /LENGTH=338 /DNA_ID=CAMNT_0024610139 /DNA_START=61 /DNA_END=1074 /DNA_ORIENTATION=+